MQTTLQPLTGTCGAEISQTNLADMSNAEFDFLYTALMQHGAVFIRDQHLNLDEFRALGRRFGSLEVHPIVDSMEDYPEVTKVLKPAGESATFGTGWHSDNTFQEKPSMGSLLYSKIIPPFGGDTLFANQVLAYETLSNKMKDMIADLKAVHSASRAYTSETAKDKYDKKTAITYTWDDSIMDEMVHPVVRTHPVTGKKALFVNDMFTLRFEGMSEAESRPLL